MSNAWFTLTILFRPEGYQFEIKNEIKVLTFIYVLYSFLQGTHDKRVDF